MKLYGIRRSPSRKSCSICSRGGNLRQSIAAPDTRKVTAHRSRTPTLFPTRTNSQVTTVHRQVRKNAQKRRTGAVRKWSKEISLSADGSAAASSSSASESRRIMQTPISAVQKSESRQERKYSLRVRWKDSIMENSAMRENALAKREKEAQAARKQIQGWCIYGCRLCAAPGYRIQRGLEVCRSTRQESLRRRIRQDPGEETLKRVISIYDSFGHLLSESDFLFFSA